MEKECSLSVSQVKRETLREQRHGFMHADILKTNLICQSFLTTILYVPFILLAKMAPLLKIQILLQQLCRLETEIFWNRLINERLVSVPCLSPNNKNFDIKTKTAPTENNIYDHSIDLFSSGENQDVVEALLALSDSLYASLKRL